MVLFGLVRKASPETLYSILCFDLFLLLIFFIILLILFLIDFEECLLLNLILKLAFANPGITLSAVSVSYTHLTLPTILLV